jgi:hypothetical protein
MKRGIASGGTVMLSTGLVAALLVLFGVVRFGGVQQIVDTDDYVQIPSWGLWVYICIPVALGLITLFSTWEDKLEQEEEKSQD